MKAWRRRIKNGELCKGAGGAACRHRPRFGRQGLLTQNRKGKIDGGPNKKKKRRLLQSLSHDDGRDDVDSKGYIHSDRGSCQTDANENVKSTYVLGTAIVFCMASMIYFLKY